jgi:hypothetical protein
VEDVFRIDTLLAYDEAFECHLNLTADHLSTAVDEMLHTRTPFSRGHLALRTHDNCTLNKSLTYTCGFHSSGRVVHVYPIDYIGDHASRLFGVVARDHALQIERVVQLNDVVSVVVEACS